MLHLEVFKKSNFYRKVVREDLDINFGEIRDTDLDKALSSIDALSAVDFEDGQKIEFIKAEVLI